MTSKEKLIEFLKSANIEYLDRETAGGWCDIIVYSTSKVYFVFNDKSEVVYIA